MLSSSFAKAPRIVDDVVGPGSRDAGLLVRPAVARIDEAKIVEAEVGAGARHHADVIGELRLHQDDRRRLAFSGDRLALHVGAANAVPQLADDAARPEPIIFARPLLGERFEARRRDRLRAFAFEAHAAIADDDFFLA